MLATESPQRNHPAGPLSTAEMDPSFAATDIPSQISLDQRYGPREPSAEYHTYKKGVR